MIRLDVRAGRRWGLLGAVLATLVIAACSEKIEGGNSCPLLCPQQAITLRDTIIDAVAADTTVTGLPPIGGERYLMLSSHGDTLQTRVIIRYDTLPTTYSKAAIDSSIVHIDTAQLVAPILPPDSLHKPQAPVTIEVYDVDTTATDTVAAVMAPLFRSDRLIGSKTFAPESLLTDTLRIPISTDTVLDRITNGTHLRVGLRVVSPLGTDVQVGSSLANLAVTLRIKASLDTSVAPVVVHPVSRTPTDPSFLTTALSDYTVVLAGATPPSPTLLSVGGVPPRRVYIGFIAPSRIIDSTTIVRASLLLTQVPNRRITPRESIYVLPVAVLSSPAITNVFTALQFLAPGGQFGLDSIPLAPGDSGVRSIEIVSLVRTWRNQTTTLVPRTVALRSGSEGQLPAQIDFFSTRAPPGLRPRLRITYVPPTNYGLP